MNTKKILYFAIGPIGSALLSCLTLPLISWYFSAQDIGRIAIFQLSVSFFAMFFTLGLDQAYVREYHEIKNKPALFKTCLFPSLLVAVIFLIGIFFVELSISEILFEIDNSKFSLAVATVLVLSIFIRYFSLILRMEERGLAFSVSNLMSKLIFVLIISSNILLVSEYLFEQLIYAHVISYVVVFFFLCFNTRATWTVSINEKININNLKYYLKFGFPLVFGSLAYWGLTSLDKVFLRFYSTYDELAIYSISTSFAGAAVIVQSIFSTIWAPTVYKWISSNSGKEEVEKAKHLILGIIIGIFSLVGMLSWVVVYILPAEYADVQYLLVVCISAPLLYTLSEVTCVGIGISRRSIFSMSASVIACLCNIIGNYYLVPVFGAKGAATSTAISFWIFLILRTEFSCFLWFRMNRVDVYILTFTSIVLSIFNLSFPHFNLTLVWLFMFLFCLYRWRYEVLNLKQEVLKVILPKR